MNEIPWNALVAPAFDQKGKPGGSASEMSIK